MGGSNIWVMSTSLLQIHTLDRFRGRVFALDFGLNILSAWFSNFVIGSGLDNRGFGPRQTTRALGAILTLPRLLWLPAWAAWARKIEPSGPRVIASSTQRSVESMKEGARSIAPWLDGSIIRPPVARGSGYPMA